MAFPLYMHGHIHGHVEPARVVCGYSGQLGTGPGEFPHGYFGCYARSVGIQSCRRDADAYANANWGSANSDTDTNTRSDADTDGNTNITTSTNINPHPYSYPNPDTDAHAHPYPCANADGITFVSFRRWYGRVGIRARYGAHGKRHSAAHECVHLTRVRADQHYKSRRRHGRHMERERD